MKQESWAFSDNYKKVVRPLFDKFFEKDVECESFLGAWWLTPFDAPVAKTCAPLCRLPGEAAGVVLDRYRNDLKVYFEEMYDCKCYGLWSFFD